MSHQRQSQWSHRLQRLQTLQERFTTAGKYDRAYRAHLIVQHIYERWADEVFATRTR